MWALIALLTPSLAFEFSFPRANDTVDFAQESVTVTWTSEPTDPPLADFIWHGDFEGGIGTWHTAIGENISVGSHEYGFDPQGVIDRLKYSDPVLHEGRVHRLQVHFRGENGSRITTEADSLRSEKFAIEGYEEGDNGGQGLRPVWGTMGLAFTAWWLMAQVHA